MNDKLLSIILLSYYSNNRISKVYTDLKAVLGKNNIPFEFIIMDDGSKDNSYDLACSLEKQYDNVRAFQLSRNYGSMYSCFAGLSLCKGACALPLVDDEQQPYDTIVEMYRLWEAGQKIIIPYRVNRDDGALSVFF